MNARHFGAAYLLLLNRRGGAPAPVASFTYEHDAAGSREITFTDTSTGDPTAWAWDFGDGVGTSTDQHPTYEYADDGDYTVTLVATNAGGDSAPAEDEISVVGYLLLATFDEDAAAPLSSPYTEGVGSLTLVQTDGEFSTSGGAFVFPAQASPVFGDQGFSSGSVARVVGRTLHTRIRFSTLISDDSLVFGWRTATGVNTAAFRGAFLFAAGPSVRPYSENVVLGLSVSNTTVYDLVSILTSDGALLFIRGGAFTNWTLIWASRGTTTTPMYAGLSNLSDAGTLDILAVRTRLPAPFQTDDGIASVNESNPSSGAAETATADGIHEVTFSLNGSPSANEVAVRLNYREQDANNKWTAYIQRNAGNTAWDFRLDSVSGGTPTNRIAVTGVGTPTTMRVICEGSLHDAYTLAATTWTKRGSQVSLSHLNSETAISVVFAAGTTVSALKSYPRTAAAYAELDRVRS